MWFSIDDISTHPIYEGHLLLIDKDMKFPNVLPILKRVEVTECSSFDHVVILPKSMDCLFFIIYLCLFFFPCLFCKNNGVLIKNAYFSEQVKNLKNSTKIKTTI